MHIKDSNGNTYTKTCNGVQYIYKVDGDFNGNITGNNVTVVLLNGDINGNVNANNGEIFLAKGDINGNVKANKILCPSNPNEQDNNNICEYCYHYYIGGNDRKYCTFGGGLREISRNKPCVHYDGEGHTTEYHVDCRRFSNDNGRCSFFGIFNNRCPASDINHCRYRIRRAE